MLLVEGAEYRLWIPDKEEQLESMIKEHSKEIFGFWTLYFDIKQKIVSKTGISSIPDGYVVALQEPLEWFVVEVELSSHPLYEHIVKQLNKFLVGIRNPESQIEIQQALYAEITENEGLKAIVKREIGYLGLDDIHYFLSKVLSKPPKIAIMIEQKDERA